MTAEDIIMKIEAEKVKAGEEDDKRVACSKTSLFSCFYRSCFWSWGATRRSPLAGFSRWTEASWPPSWEPPSHIGSSWSSSHKAEIIDNWSFFEATFDDKKFVKLVAHLHIICKFCPVNDLIRLKHFLSTIFVLNIPFDIKHKKIQFPKIPV